MSPRIFSRPTPDRRAAHPDSFRKRFCPPRTGRCLVAASTALIGRKCSAALPGSFAASARFNRISQELRRQAGLEGFRTR